MLGIVYNVFEAVDVITLIKGGTYDDLSLSVGEALKKRSPVLPSCLDFTFYIQGDILTSHRTFRASTPAQSTMVWTPSLTLSASHGCTD